MREELCRSARLRIRPWSDDDIPRLFEIYSDPRVSEFLPSLHANTLDEVRERHPKLLATTTRYGPGYGAWAVERLSDGYVVGTGLLKHLPGLGDDLTEQIEVGWHLGADCWGHGYATEMGDALLTHGFDAQGLDEIYALADPANAGSIAVMKRIGMHYVGPNTRYYGGDEAVVYRIDRAAFVSREV